MTTDPNIELIDAKCFLAIDEHGSIRAAARETGIALNTLRYRLDRLEQRVGTPLFRRSRQGVRTTDAGDTMREIALEMIEAAARIEGRPQDVLIRPGQLTIACTEALGALWLTPRLDALKPALGDTTIGLHCSYDLRQNLGEIADIGIVFAPPSNQELIIARLATLHFLAYASHDYLETYGIPASLEDLRNHRFVEQDAPGMNAHLREHLIGGDTAVFLRTNSSLPVYYAVAGGNGIAAMPSYFSLLSDRLRPIDLGSRLRFDMYYFYHRDARESPAVRAGIDWIKSLFDPRRYPCFADEFVHPDKFPADSASAEPASWLPGLDG